MPVEASAATRNRIDRRGGVHVVPRETRKHDRHILESQTIGFCQIGLDFVLIEPIGVLLVAESSDSPGAENIERAIDSRPRFISLRITAECAPASRNAANERDAISWLGIVLEEVDDLRSLVRRRSAIAETEAPYRQHWPSVMLEVARTLGDPQRVDHVDPIALHGFDNRFARMTRDVIHDCEDASVRFCGLSYIAR